MYNAGNLTRGMIKALTNVSLSVAGCRNQGLAEVSRRSIQRKYSTISFFVDRIKNFRIIKDQRKREIFGCTIDGHSLSNFASMKFILSSPRERWKDRNRKDRENSMFNSKLLRSKHDNNCK